MTEVDLLQRLARGLCPDLSGQALFPVLVAELRELLGCSLVVLSEPLPDHQERARTLAVQGPDGPEAGFEFDLAGTPCAKALRGEVCLFPDGVCDHFPENELLRARVARGYAGCRLVASNGQPLGVLMALFREPLDNPDRALAITRLFAMRASADLEQTSFYESLRAREESLQSLVSSCPMGIHEWAVDTHGRLVFVGTNPAADRITSVRGSSLFGLEIEEAFPGLAGTELPKRYLKAAVEGVPFEIRNFDYDDAVAGGFYDVFAFQTRPGRMAAMFLEVSDRLKTEKAMRQAQKMEAVGQLAGGVAHDFNNLLQAINGYTELARQDLPTEHPARRSLEQVARASLRASSLAGRLLAFSRHETPSLQPLALAPVLADIIQLLKRLLGGNVSVNLEVKPGLKSVLADPGLIEQVLLNLCINARDAMPDGGEVSVTAARIEVPTGEPATGSGIAPGEYDLVTVSDTGCGVPPELHEKIFEPLFTTKEGGRGTGLGLPMVASIMQDLGGGVILRSQVGVGSDFMLYFPVTEAEAPTPPPDTGTGPEEGWKGGLVMVAEDDDLLRHLTREVLERAGFRVLTASTGEQAWQLYQEHRFALRLAILDVMMPRVGGQELFRRFREEGASLPVLITSGYSLPASASWRAEESGLVDCLAKPYSPRQFLEKVRHLLALASKAVPESS